LHAGGSRCEYWWKSRQRNLPPFYPAMKSDVRFDTSFINHRQKHKESEIRKGGVRQMNTKIER
jgi:hypothetical protein